MESLAWKMGLPRLPVVQGGPARFASGSGRMVRKPVSLSVSKRSVSKRAGWTSEVLNVVKLTSSYHPLSLQRTGLIRCTTHDREIPAYLVSQIKCLA